MTYLTAPPALDRASNYLNAGALKIMTRTRAACRSPPTSSSNRLSLELDVVIFHPLDS